MCAGPDAKMAKTPAAAAAAPAGGPPAHLTVAGVTYDVSEFQRRHPGGTLVLQPFLGQDATHQFTAFHSKEAWNLLRTLPRVSVPRPCTGRAKSLRAAAAIAPYPRPAAPCRLSPSPAAPINPAPCCLAALPPTLAGGGRQAGQAQRQGRGRGGL